MPSKTDIGKKLNWDEVSFLQLWIFVSYLFVELDDSTEEEKDVTLVTTAVATAIAE